MVVMRGPLSLSLPIKSKMGGLWFSVFVLALAILLPTFPCFSQAAPKSAPKAPAPKAPLKVPPKTQKKVTEEERLQQLYDSGRTFQLSGDSERAATAYTAFLTEALRSIARANLRMGQTDQAEKLLGDILAIAPNDA